MWSRGRMVRALGLELAGPESNANLRLSVVNMANHLHVVNIANLHVAWRCFPEGRTLINNSLLRTGEGKY